VAAAAPPPVRYLAPFAACSISLITTSGRETYTA